METRTKKVLMVALLWLLVSASAFAEEKIISARTGRVIAAGYGFGQIFAFPSEEMDGFFFFEVSALMGTWNSIYFYDFRERQEIRVLSGGQEDGPGTLMNELTRERLGEDGVTGLIEEVVLDDNGHLIFETEDGNHYRISFRDERELAVSAADANEVDLDARFILRASDMNAPDDEMLVSSYKKTIETEAVTVKVKEREIRVSSGNTDYLIEGLSVFGVQLSQDLSQLAVFGRVSILDIKVEPAASGMDFFFTTEQEKAERLEEFEQDTSEENARTEVSERFRKKLLGETWNIIVIYDLNKPPFIVGEPEKQERAK